MTPLRIRFATEIGTRISLRRYWNGKECPKGYHNANTFIVDEYHPAYKVGDIHTHRGGDPKDYAESLWPTVCRDCGAPVPADAPRQVFNDRLYDTPSGALEPGCLHWIPYYEENTFWDNHKGPHLAVLVPTGELWIIDSRASNCGSPEERTHRCWVRHGDPEKGILHVDKSGHTCTAGGGSIQTTNYHGFLHDNHFHL